MTSISEKTIQQTFLFSYVHLKCVIVISNNTIERKIFIFQKFMKNYTVIKKYTVPAKFTAKPSFKVSILHAKFCSILYNGIQDKTITRIWGKTGQQHPLLSYIYQNCIIVIFFHRIYIVHKIFCAILFSRNQDYLNPKILQKV